eukprot:11528821-Karenia_brevis.AAC.1
MIRLCSRMNYPDHPGKALCLDKNDQKHQKHDDDHDHDDDYDDDEGWGWGWIFPYEQSPSCVVGF